MDKFGLPVSYLFGPSVKNLALRFSIYSVLHIRSSVPARYFDQLAGAAHTHKVVIILYCHFQKFLFLFASFFFFSDGRKRRKKLKKEEKTNEKSQKRNLTSFRVRPAPRQNSQQIALSICSLSTTLEVDFKNGSHSTSNF